METKNKTKKALLKKIMKSGKSLKGNPLKGASPFPMDNGLGNMPPSPSGDVITGGGGSNLGTNGVF